MLLDEGLILLGPIFLLIGRLSEVTFSGLISLQFSDEH